MSKLQVAGLMALSLGCGSSGGPEQGSPQDGGGDGAGGGPCRERSFAFQQQSGPVDLLFVIDNSTSMTAEQQRLLGNSTS